MSADTRFATRRAECEVCVVGAGIIGLATALEFLEAGFRNVSVVADSFGQDTTSFGAGAIWRPVFLSEADDASALK